MLVVVRRDCVPVNLEGQRGDGPVEGNAPVGVAKGGEDEGGGFSGDAGEGQHAAGNDAGRCGLDGNGEDGAPVGNAEGQGCFADGMGHHEEHFFRGAGDGGDHHDAQGDAAGDGGEGHGRGNDESVDGHAHDDGGDAVEDVGGESDGVGQLGSATEFSEEDAAADADGDSDEAGEAEQDAGADDGVGHAAADFAFRLGDLGKESHVQRAGAFVNEIAEDGEQRGDDQNGGGHGESGGQIVCALAPH